MKYTDCISCAIRYRPLGVQRICQECIKLGPDVPSWYEANGRQVVPWEPLPGRDDSNA